MAKKKSIFTKLRWFFNKKTTKNKRPKNELDRNYSTFFGIKLTRNYWLFIFGLTLSLITYFIQSSNPDDALLWQLHIKIRNLCLYFWSIYTIRKYELVRIPVQSSIRVSLDKGVNHPSYGSALIAIAIIFGLIISGAAAVLVAST